jgi:pSer/pThr/pTyr-binding forkhead associated (FHA) protein
VVPVPIPDEPSPSPGDTRVYGTAEPERDEDTPAPVVEPGPARAAVVVGGTRHEVERPVLTLGRARECDIVVDDPSVSRRHAELRRGPGGFTLIDLKSTNGTQVNGKAIEQAEVDDGDRITLGQTELRFERF